MYVKHSIRLAYNSDINPVSRINIRQSSFELMHTHSFLQGFESSISEKPNGYHCRWPLGWFVQMHTTLEGNLHRSPEDSGLVGGGYDLAEGIRGQVGILSGCSTGGSGGISGWNVEVGVVQDVESFQT